MKLYTVVEYSSRMCMKKGNSGLKNIKGDNYLCWAGYPFSSYSQF